MRTSRGKNSMMEGIKKNESVPETKEELPDNVILLERPEARYRIIYELHNLPHGADAIGYPDALALEGAALRGTFEDRESVEKFISIYWQQKLSRAPKGKFKEAIAQESYIINQKIPLYLIDIGDPHLNFDSVVSTRSALKRAEAVGSLGAVTYGIAKVLERRREKKDLTRRDFLKLFGAGAISAYTGTQLLDVLVELYQENKKEHFRQSAVESNFRKIQEIIHPETEAAILTFRNAIWAQKLEFLARRLRKEKKPELAMIAGVYHSGLENMLKEDQDKRLNSVKRFLKIFGGGSISLSPVARVEFKENRWRATEIVKEPRLEKIEKELWPVNTP